MGRLNGSIIFQERLKQNMFIYIYLLIQSMRPKQWTKNLVIFAPVVFDAKLLVSAPLFEVPLIKTCLGFLLMSLVTGSIYLLNDILDVNEDRLHPQKKMRPIASGRLPVGCAVMAAIILPLLALPMAFWLNTSFGYILSIYIAINLGYSWKLKHVVILDVLIIAAGFVLRVAAGVPLVVVERFSPWMYVCIALLALFLGFSKRRQEIVQLKTDAGKARAILSEYNLGFLDNMLNVIMGCTITAYSLYTFLAEGLPKSHAMMLTIPFVMYGIFRYLYLMQVEAETAPPDEILMKDRPIQAGILLWAISVVLILYVLPKTA